MQLLKTVEDVRKNVDIIKRDSGKLQDRIHRTAVSILKLWETKTINAVEAGGLITDLQSASPYHANAFSKWVGLMTPLKWSDENKNWYGHTDDQFKGKQFIEARDNPFWKVSPPAAPKPFDMMAELHKVVAKADKRTENKDKGTDDDVIPGPLVRALKDLLSKAEAEKQAAAA